MKQLLQKFGLLKTNSQKEIEKKLDDIAFKKKKNNKILLKKENKKINFLKTKKKSVLNFGKILF